MQFCCFNPMPWPDLTERPTSWPFPNDSFDSKRAEQYYNTYIDQLVFAEKCGFDWLALGEDHMTAYGLTPNPHLVLSVLGHRTRKVKLAVLGCPLPLLNPIRVAEECAMLDVLTGGRLIAGFIRGVPQNYAAYNVEPNESRQRFSEANDLIIKAWTERGTFKWASEYYTYPAVSVWPVPLQKPHPPLVYSANSTTSATFAAERRATIGAIHLYSRDALGRVGKAISAYREKALVDGWSPQPDRFLIGLQTCIAESDDRAAELLSPALHYQYNILSGTFDAEKRKIASEKPGYGFSPVEEKPPSLEERLKNRIILCGSPQTVVEQIEYLQEKLGVGIISMHFQVGNIADNIVRTGLRLFRDKVLPHFRQGATCRHD